MLISNSITSASDSISKFKAAAAASDPPFPLVPAPPASIDHPGGGGRTAAEMLFFANPSAAPLPPHLLSFDPIIVRPPVFPENACNTLQLSSPSSYDDADEDGDDSDDDDHDEDDIDDDEKEDGNVDGNLGEDSDNPTMPRSDLPHNPAVHTASKKRKRKTSTSMMAFFEGLIKKVIEKQEKMQQKFLQALEKRESDRMIREEAWRRQEMARLSKEHELRAQERSSAQARDAALIAFLQKATGQSIDLPTMSTMIVPIAAQPVQCARPLHQENAVQQYEDQDPSDPNSKRWLKPEVLALIDLHSSLQAKFTEAGPKGHLWEEVADGMAKLGYSSRTAKRCKEKWENINKYYKRAKDSNKKRPENAKTCPYFHELDALYRKGVLGSSNANQMPYKPSIEHAQYCADDDGTACQPSSTSIVTGEGSDVAVQALPSCAPAMLLIETTTDINNSVAVFGGGGSGDVNNNITSDLGIGNTNNCNGVLQGRGSPMHFSTDSTVHGAPTSTNPNSGAKTSSFTAELGLHSAATMDLYQHKNMNESETGSGNTAREQEIQAQSGKQESRPVVLAPLPNSSSFMSSLLLKMNSSSNSVS